MVVQPLPRVLLLHTGGTLGMDPDASYDMDGEGHMVLKPATGGRYERGLRPGNMLENLLGTVPELQTMARLDLQVRCTVS